MKQPHTRHKAASRPFASLSTGEHVSLPSFSNPLRFFCKIPLDISYCGIVLVCVRISKRSFVDVGSTRNTTPSGDRFWNRMPSGLSSKIMITSSSIGDVTRDRMSTTHGLARDHVWTGKRRVRRCNSGPISRFRQNVANRLQSATHSKEHVMADTNRDLQT